MPRKRFRRLGLFYIVALSCIALSIVVSQLLVQRFISRQQDDSRVINVAGKQRMLGQKISKVALQIAFSESPGTYRTEYRAELEETLTLLIRSHEGLLHGDTLLQLPGGNTDTIRSLFEQVQPHYLSMVRNAETLLAQLGSDPPDREVIARSADGILRSEAPFLEGMDRIVYQYENDAREKVDKLKNMEFLLLAVSLLIILLELIFIFRPLATNVRATVSELIESEEASKKMASDMSKLYEELVKSYQDLEAVNLKPDSPITLAGIDREGKFTYFSDYFKRLMEYEPDEIPSTLTGLLKQSDYKDYFISGLMRLIKNGRKWSGEVKLINASGDFCWLEIFIIPVNLGNEIKIIGHDVTELKEAKMRSREINRERIEKMVREQNYRSVLILEGQEEERKRLSRELHDGVGQMLSAMKLSLESIAPSNAEHMKIRLREALSLMKSIIQEVRRVSFNLTPSSLDDFGLVPAVKKFCEEINSVTKSEVSFVNHTRFINRLESHIETNLYRIIQEAVNNALKYAKASRITVSFSHTINALNITIEDDGKGFDFERLVGAGHFEKAGHGIFNMKERTAFIGGVFKLDTQIGHGTRILVTLSLD